jgi:hypothetical protein
MVVLLVEMGLLFREGGGCGPIFFSPAWFDFIFWSDVLMLWVTCFMLGLLDRLIKCFQDCDLVPPLCTSWLAQNLFDRYLIQKSGLHGESPSFYLRLMHQNFWPAYVAVVDAFFSAASKALTEFRKSLIGLQEKREWFCAEERFDQRGWWKVPNFWSFNWAPISIDFAGEDQTRDTWANGAWRSCWIASRTRSEAHFCSCAERGNWFSANKFCPRNCDIGPRTACETAR